jgi:hypothetical protein
MATNYYEVRVVGSLGPAAREAFADLAVEVEPTSTLLAGELAQADLRALLDQVRALGLEVVEVKQTSSPPLRRRRPPGEQRPT